MPNKKFDNRFKEHIDTQVEDLETEIDEEDEDEKDKDKKNKLDEDQGDEEDEETDEDDEESDDDDGEDEDTDDDESDEEDEDDVLEKKKLQKEQDEKDRIEREKKEKESQREALVQRSRSKQLTDKIREASKLEVSDDDLKSEAEKEGLDFDVLDTFQKSMLKRTILAERKFSTVSEVVVEDDKVREWADKVDTFLDDEESLNKYPRLVNKENKQAFKNFMMKESRRGLDLDDGVKSFLFDLPAAKKKHKGSLLLNRGGGDKVKKRELNEEDVVSIRKHNPKKYMDLVRKGKIDIKV